MSEIQSLAAPKASFDRRSVVKTAAWSVPVIAAAIAAPAAAASTTSATAAYLPLSGNTKFHVRGSETKPAEDRKGKGTKGFTITNSGSNAINGPISGTIIITPGSGVDINVYTLTSAGLALVLSPDTDASAGYSASFTTNSTTIAPGGTLTFALTYNCTALSPNGVASSMAVFLTVPGSSLQLGPTALTLG